MHIDLAAGAVTNSAAGQGCGIGFFMCRTRFALVGKAVIQLHLLNLVCHAVARWLECSNRAPTLPPLAQEIAVQLPAQLR